MSRLFSITSRISEAMMFSAATMTMSPMVMEMAIFSRRSAENRLRFRSDQLWGMYSGPRRAVIDSTTSSALNMSSTRSSM
jgi:hypothetical protein